MRSSNAGRDSPLGWALTSKPLTVVVVCRALLSPRAMLRATKFSTLPNELRRLEEERRQVRNTKNDPAAAAWPHIAAKASGRGGGGLDERVIMVPGSCRQLLATKARIRGGPLPPRRLPQQEASGQPLSLCVTKRGEAMIKPVRGLRAPRTPCCLHVQCCLADPLLGDGGDKKSNLVDYMYSNTSLIRTRISRKMKNRLS